MNLLQKFSKILSLFSQYCMLCDSCSSIFNCTHWVTRMLLISIIIRINFHIFLKRIFSRTYIWPLSLIELKTCLYYRLWKSVLISNHYSVNIYETLLWYSGERKHKIYCLWVSSANALWKYTVLKLTSYYVNIALKNAGILSLQRRWNTLIFHYYQDN